MKAMILAAGLGTRLWPLTDDRPKALVTVAGRTLLEIALDRLRSFGIREIIVNTHHFADQVADYLAAHRNFGMRIEISREPDLLDTGGGLKQAAWFFREPGDNPDQPFLLHNVDVLSAIDLAAMLRFHTEHAAVATLAVQDRKTSRPLLFDGQGQFQGRAAKAAPAAKEQAPANHLDVLKGHDFSRAKGAEQTGGALAPEGSFDAPKGTGFSPYINPPQPAGALAPEGMPIPLQPLAFNGIHVLSPRIFSKLSEQGVFSIIDAYIRLAAEGEKILAYRADNSYWRDLGRPESLTAAAHDLESGIYP